MDDPRPLLRPLLAALRSPAQRRQFAVELRVLADEQDALADAEERSGTRVRALRERATHNAEKRPGRPRGSGGRFVRYAPPVPGAHSGQLHIAPALYQEIGTPARVDLQRLAGRLVIRGCSEGVGWHAAHRDWPGAGGGTGPGRGTGECQG
jgi:hypothetical protein